MLEHARHIVPLDRRGCMIRSLVAGNIGWLFAVAVLALLTGSVPLEVRAADAVAEADPGAQEILELVRARYRQWLLDAPVAKDTHAFVHRQYEAAIYRARWAQRAAATVSFNEPANVYDTSNSCELPALIN